MASSTSDYLRRFWLPGLADVPASRPRLEIRGWLSAGNFQVYSPLHDPCTLNFSDVSPICQAVSQEIDRFCLASVESIASVRRVERLPKAKAWCVVQWYYAAFYAAHAILRMMGISVTFLERGHVVDIGRVGALFGQSSSLQAGLYKVSVDARNRQVSLSQLAAKGGSHEAMWRCFDDFLKGATIALLSGPGASQELQHAMTKMDRVRSILSLNGKAGGAWLSSVRNAVNYRHSPEVWFPYSEHEEEDLQLFTQAERTPTDCDSIDVSDPATTRDLESFSQVCRYIVALCVDSAEEMERRSGARVPFHRHGVLHLMSVLDQ